MEAAHPVHHHPWKTRNEGLLAQTRGAHEQELCRGSFLLPTMPKDAQPGIESTQTGKGEGVREAVTIW